MSNQITSAEKHQNETLAFEDIIQRRIDFLNGISSEDIDPSMKIVVDNNDSLHSELQFIDSLWKDHAVSEDQQPSADLNARFYRMLTQAQTDQTGSIISSQSSSEKLDGVFGFWRWLSGFFKFQSASQISLLLLLFLGGWFSNHWLAHSKNESTARLERQVASLNTLVAMTMLNNQSATERLAGVSYSKDSQLNNHGLMTIMLNMLNNDDSNAVRLAVVDALTEQSDLLISQSELLASLHLQDSPIVQIALMQLLLSGNSRLSKEQIENLIKDRKLDKGVIEHLKTYTNQPVSNSRRI